MLLLTLLPWWLGLPLLLALIAALLLLPQRLEISGYAGVIRHALRWGLPGCLLALQRALGGDVFAWVTALLGALAGYTLLIALESWLDRERRGAPEHASADHATSAEWPELALAPVGPAAKLIELESPHWLPVAGPLDDPRGGVVTCRGGRCCFASGECVDEVGEQVGFSPDGRWFAAQMIDQGGVILWDRARQQHLRLPGRQLDGWYQGQPWLSRGEGDMPVALSAVPGGDDDR